MTFARMAFIRLWILILLMGPLLSHKEVHAAPSPSPTPASSPSPWPAFKPSFAPVTCAKPWIFFDLGQTLVDTDTFNYKKIFYMPGAYQYLVGLKKKGYKLGLLVNIPERWGKDESTKLKAMKDFVEKPWTDTQPIDWTLFDAGILIPSKDEYRKPHPYLFEKAAALAAANGCVAIFEGEEIPEVLVARKSGLKAYQCGIHRGEFFLPEAKIPEWLKEPSQKTL